MNKKTIPPMTWERKDVIKALKKLKVKGWNKYTPTNKLKELYYKRK